MTETAAPPPTPVAYPVLDDIDHSVFGFFIEGWEEIPYPTGRDWFSTDERERRLENADKYRKHGGDKIIWNCYLKLGFFAYEDCSDFEELWNEMETDPLSVHQVIWYQFLYHMDRKLAISPQLEKWATALSHEYLMYHDPETLRVNTAYSFEEWIVNQEEDATMEEDDNANKLSDEEDTWSEVESKGRSRSKSPNKAEPVPQSYSIPGWTRETNKDGSRTHLRPAELRQYEKLVKPASRPPQGVTTVKEGDEDATQLDESISVATARSVETGSVRSEALPRPTSFPIVSVNDGTHRVTVKWKPTGGLTSYASGAEKLRGEVKDLLCKILEEHDGCLYPWGTEVLTQTIPTTSLTMATFDKYVAPSITLLKSTSQVVFSVRFGFADNPTTWSNTDAQRLKLKELQSEVRYYNSSSSGGKLVIAGFVMLKTPGQTSLHRYTQYLRHKMPSNTAFFDVERYKKTPMEQPIHHLAVLCGEKDVTPVSQALSQVLTGKGTTVFLPRYTFSAMTEAQISSQFLFHDKWLQSLKSISLAPHIFHVDQPRIEYNNDGTTTQRSTREWAGTLVLPDGSAALCDVANGTKDKKAVLLAPAHYLDQAKKELRSYRMRLAPHSHREAKFRDSVTDLPDEIHIQTSAASNISFMTNLLSASVWTALPDPPDKTNHGGIKSVARKPGKQKLNKKRNDKQEQNAWEKPLQQTQPIDSIQTTAAEEDSKSEYLDDEEFTPSIEGRASLSNDDLSTASTQSLTQASETKLQAQLRELEYSTQKKLDTLRTAGRAASKQLESLEGKFQAFAEETNTKMAAVNTEIKKVVTQLDKSVAAQEDISTSLETMQAHTSDQFARMGGHILANGISVDALTDSITEIRSEMTRLFGLIATDIAGRTSLATQQSSSPAGEPILNDIRCNATGPQQNANTQVATERSPPPKRTRDGEAMTPDTIATTPDTAMDTSMEDSTSVLDITIEDDDDGTFDAATSILDTTFEEAEETDDDSEVSVGAPLSLTALAALHHRFEAVHQTDLLTQTPLEIIVTQPLETAQPTQQSRPSLSNAAPAPLAPQYAKDTGLAGAPDT